MTDEQITALAREYAEEATKANTTIIIRLMKFYRFIKYWSLAWMSASIGAAFGSFLNKDYGYTIFCVVTCAINHFCYNVWNKQLKDT